MSDRRYLAIFLVLGLAAGLLVVATFLFGSPNTGPRALKEIAPLPGSQVPLQTPIEVDLPVGYRVEILVDGFRVPDSEVRFVEGTSVHSWAPARSSTIVWRPRPPHGVGTLAEGEQDRRRGRVQLGLPGLLNRADRCDGGGGGGGSTPCHTADSHPDSLVGRKRPAAAVWEFDISRVTGPCPACDLHHLNEGLCSHCWRRQ